MIYRKVHCWIESNHTVTKYAALQEIPCMRGLFETRSFFSFRINRTPYLSPEQERSRLEDVYGSDLVATVYGPLESSLLARRLRIPTLLQRVFNLFAPQQHCPSVPELPQPKRFEKPEGFDFGMLQAIEDGIARAGRVVLDFDRERLR